VDTLLPLPGASRPHLGPFLVEPDVDDLHMQNCPFVGQCSSLKKHVLAAKRKNKTAKCRCLGYCPAVRLLLSHSLSLARRSIVS